MASFSVPEIQDNPLGWGPVGVPSKFENMPYQPFSKGDRLGKVADWNQQNTYYHERRSNQKYSGAYGSGNQSNQYSYYHGEDESTFKLVDNTKVQKPQYQRNRWKFNQFKNRQQQQQRQLNQQLLSNQPQTKLEKKKERERQIAVRKMQKQYGATKFRYKERQLQMQQKKRAASVAVKDDWEMIDEIEFSRFTKLKKEVAEPQDLYVCGELQYYDKNYDRVAVKNSKPLKNLNTITNKVTTSNDLVLRKLAGQCTVMATDSILATLMCCTRSAYSWDIIAHRIGNKLIFDKRENSNFDLLTVSETANQPPEGEGLNSPINLATEATKIDHSFLQQVLKPGNTHKMKNQAPPVSGEAPKAYRYRKWDLGNGIQLVARTEHDAVMVGPTGEDTYINVKALNEWDHRSCNGVEWRRKLDTQRGSVLATELKNNSNKLAKWTMRALLAGSEYIKMGMVARSNINDSKSHDIIGALQFIPREFANQINLNVSNAWGILRCIIDLCMKQDKGKYLILKDPNKPIIRLYKLPSGEFSDDEEDEEEESSDEEDGSDEGDE